MTDWLSVAATPDFVTPLVAAAQDLAHGPSVAFIYLYESCCGATILGILKEHHIEAWGWMKEPGGDKAMFSVEEKDAQQTYILLLELGVEFDSIPGESLEASDLMPESHVHIRCPWCSGRNDYQESHCNHCGGQL